MYYLWLVPLLMLSSCAYRMGYGQRSLPGGYTQVSIPVFKNQSDQVGAEVYFTNSLIREFERAQVARVSISNDVPVVLDGVIKSIAVIGSGLVQGGAGSSVKDLPANAVLSTTYQIVITTHLIFRRLSDQQILWQGEFQREGVYRAPLIGSLGVNSANANYNKSAREQKIAQIAEEMMEEAHERITENF